MKARAILIYHLIVLSLFSFAQKTTIKIVGSEIMRPFMQKLADVYMKKNPKVKIVIDGGHTNVGILQLYAGTDIDLVMSSRALREYELIQLNLRNGFPPYQIPIAMSCLAFFVHPSNPVKALSFEDLIRIYADEAPNWKEFGGLDVPIKPYSLSSYRGTFLYFKKNILDGRRLGNNVIEVDSTDLMIPDIVKNPSAIGYGSPDYAKNKPVKICPIKIHKDSTAYLPTYENAVNGYYPATRNLFLICKEQPTGVVRDFIQWTLTPEAQRMLLEFGVFPIRPID
ncbi:MAG: phosphate ABC transporter substrate-binding protein [Bacteroidia bacterium]|nr:phosphate ABC transporter substrate-binding protein [Bacteroidia bacterium]MDW8301064.1 phosphate ABC transporter substrate-binding protein [Bacteroidia bacterium]